MAKPSHQPDADVVAVFDCMIAGVPGVERKGASMPYVSINGNMYAMISRENRIGLRLAKNDLAEFLAMYETGLHEGYPGHVQKQYAVVPETLYDDTEALQAWFKRSHRHAETLKSKPTKRRK